MIAVVFGVQRTVKKKRELPGQTRRRYARAVRITRRADYTRHVNTVSSRTTAPCRPDTRLQWRFPGRVRTCTLPKTVTAGPPLHRNGPSEPRHRDFASRFLTNERCILFVTNAVGHRWAKSTNAAPGRIGSATFSVEKISRNSVVVMFVGTVGDLPDPITKCPKARRLRVLRPQRWGS